MKKIVICLTILTMIICVGCGNVAKVKTEKKPKVKTKAVKIIERKSSKKEDAELKEAEKKEEVTPGVTPGKKAEEKKDKKQENKVTATSTNTSASHKENKNSGGSSAPTPAPTPVHQHNFNIPIYQNVMVQAPYDEPIYEMVEHMVCKTCGAYIENEGVVPHSKHCEFAGWYGTAVRERTGTQHHEAIYENRIVGYQCGCGAKK